MKTTIKLALVVCLLGSMTFAEDGNQGSGGRNCGGLNQPQCPAAIAADDDLGILPGEDGTDAIDIAVITMKQLFWTRF